MRGLLLNSQNVSISSSVSIVLRKQLADIFSFLARPPCWAWVKSHVRVSRQFLNRVALRVGANLPGAARGSGKAFRPGLYVRVLALADFRLGVSSSRLRSIHRPAPSRPLPRRAEGAVNQPVPGHFARQPCSCCAVALPPPGRLHWTFHINTSAEPFQFDGRSEEMTMGVLNFQCL